MKKILLSITAVIVIAFLGYWGTEMYQFANGIAEDSKRMEQFRLNKKIQNGDIIFQTSKSGQSKAIQLATNSKYSHMGIIYENEGDYFVYEAVQPVKLTPLTEWINRGENKHYVIKRLKNSEAILTPERQPNEDLDERVKSETEIEEGGV